MIFASGPRGTSAGGFFELLMSSGPLSPGVGRVRHHMIATGNPQAVGKASVFRIETAVISFGIQRENQDLEAGRHEALMCTIINIQGGEDIVCADECCRVAGGIMDISSRSLIE